MSLRPDTKNSEQFLLEMLSPWLVHNFKVDE